MEDGKYASVDEWYKAQDSKAQNPLNQRLSHRIAAVNFARRGPDLHYDLKGDRLGALTISEQTRRQQMHMFLEGVVNASAELAHPIRDA